MFVDSRGAQENIQASTPGSNVRRPAWRASGPASNEGPRCWCTEQPSPAPLPSRRRHKAVPSQGKALPDLRSRIPPPQSQTHREQLQMSRLTVKPHSSSRCCCPVTLYTPVTNPPEPASSSPKLSHTTVLGRLTWPPTRGIPPNDLHEELPLPDDVFPSALSVLHRTTSPPLQHTAQAPPRVQTRAAPASTQHIPASGPKERAAPARASLLMPGKKTQSLRFQGRSRGKTPPERQGKGWDVDPAVQEAEGLGAQQAAPHCSASPAASAGFNPPGTTE